MQQKMIRSPWLIKCLAAMSIAGMMIVTSSAANAAAGDVADGYCDGFKGKQRALCVKAHASAKQVERLEEKGSTVKQLDKAKQKLADATSAYQELTGSGVPGLTPVCEIPELVAWSETQQERVADGILNSDAVIEANSTGLCQLSYDFQAEYSANHRCTQTPRITLRNRETAMPLNAVPSIISDGSVGSPIDSSSTETSSNVDGYSIISNVYWCSISITVTYNQFTPLDYSTFATDAEIGACARAYGCDAF